jgi:dihydroorotase
MVAGAIVYDLLLKGGRIVDPKNKLDGTYDLAVREGQIAAIAPSLEPSLARVVHDVAGALVVPGLIDLHTHVYHKATFLGVDPDPIAARSSVATMVDAGSAGAGNFAGLRDFVMASSPFRILAYLNISYPGIFAFDRDLMFGEASIRDLLSVERCAAVVEANRDIIVGVKVRLGDLTSGEVGLEALDRAIAAAERVDLPVMSHVGQPPPGYGEILARLRPGDILTHCFRPAPNAPVDDAGHLLPALTAAREKGVLFDIGHGMGAFGFASAEAAIEEGFAPDIISSDVHTLSVGGPAYDLLHTMSKLFTCGVPLPRAIAMVTEAPARAMQRDDLGHLSVGARADISLLDIIEAHFPFVDVAGVVRESAFLLKPVGLYLGGRFVDPAPRQWEERYYERSSPRF